MSQPDSDRSSSESSRRILSALADGIQNGVTYCDNPDFGSGDL